MIERSSDRIVRVGQRAALPLADNGTPRLLRQCDGDSALSVSQIDLHEFSLKCGLLDQAKIVQTPQCFRPSGLARALDEHARPRDPAFPGDTLVARRSPLEQNPQAALRLRLGNAEIALKKLELRKVQIR